MHFSLKAHSSNKTSIKAFILLAILLTLFHSSQAQTPISIAYFSPYFSQPGAKIGSSFLLADLDKTGVSRELRIAPQLGYFSQIGVNQNYLANAELSLRKKRDGKKYFQRFGLGLGYLLSSTRLGPTVNLGSAIVSSGERERDSFISPTLSYGLGFVPDKGPSYFFRLFLGQNISWKNDGELFFGFESGITLNNK